MAATECMQALVWREGRGLRLEDVERPTVAEDDQDNCVVKVSHCGVCGTDLHILTGSFGFWPTRIMGHEIVGVDTATGQRVFANPLGECGRCRGCRAGKSNLCRLAWTGDALGIVRDGGWAQYLLTPRQRLIPLPDDIPMHCLALAEPLSCVVQGFRRLGRVDSSHETLVLGAGIIGILWLVCLHHKGARRLTVVELSESRRAIVDRMGLDVRTLSPAELGASDQTFDIIVDCTGSPAAFDSSVGRLKKAGTYLVFGCAAAGAQGKFDLSAMVLNQWRILGVRMNPYTSREAVALVTDLYRAGLLDFERIGVCVYPLAEHAAALEALRNNEHTKVLFELPQ